MSNTTRNRAQQFADQLASALDDVALGAINGGLTPEQAKFVGDITANALLRSYGLEEGRTPEEFKAKLAEAMELIAFPKSDAM